MVTKPNVGLWVTLRGNLEGGIVAGRDETATIPYLSLASLDSDATVGPQLPGQNAVQLASALRAGNDADIVMKSEEAFIRQEMGLG